MALDSYADILAYILRRAYEDDTDATGDWYDDAGNAIIQAWRDLTTRHPWLDLVKAPPGAFVLTDDVTTLTLTVVTAGTNVAGTLSSAHATSLTGYKVRPSGKSWVARITDHTAGMTTLTLDAVPETLAAEACTIFQDEYDLASDLGVFVDGLWLQDGSFVVLKDEEWLKATFPDPPSAGRATHFCRLTRRRIRLSSYPTAVERVEYPYCYEPSDPSGTSTLAIGAHLRPALAEMAYALLLDMKLDKRAPAAEIRAERLIERAIAYESRRKTGLGLISARASVGPYGETSRYGGYGA